MKKDNIWIILVAIVVIIIMNQTDKKESRTGNYRCVDTIPDNKDDPFIFGESKEEFEQTSTPNWLEYSRQGDWCQDEFTLLERYCSTYDITTNPNIMAQKEVHCPGGCSGGVCLACTTSGCPTYGDTYPACNGIDRTELGNVAQGWMGNPTSDLRTKLGNAAQNWMSRGGI